MAMVGHETESIYRRYAIQDEAMLREGAALLERWNDEQHTLAKQREKGKLKQFKKRARA
jgi:hypothetical protein